MKEKLLGENLLWFVALSAGAVMGGIFASIA